MLLHACRWLAARVGSGGWGGAEANAAVRGMMVEVEVENECLMEGAMRCCRVI